MDIGREGSYQGQVFWGPGPATPKPDPKPNCENGSKPAVGFSGSEGGVFDMNAVLYDSFVLDNMWNAIPCRDLLALADAAVTTKSSGGGCGGSGGGGGGTNGGWNEVNMHCSGDGGGGINDGWNEVNMHHSGGGGGNSINDGWDEVNMHRSGGAGGINGGWNEVDMHHSGGGGGGSINGGWNEVNMHPDSQQYVQPERKRYLFDLNSPPVVTEPQLITCVSSPITPKRIQKPQLVSDIINSNEDRRTDQAAHKQDVERFNLEQPQQIIEPAHDTVSLQLELDEDSEEILSDDFNLKKTPQPKQRRRKHRPKVVIEGQTKSAKKSTTPKLDGSSTGKRKYVRKIACEKPTTTPTTRNSCRRKINFEAEQNLHTEKKTQIELTELESQSISPITPNKTEPKHQKPAKNTKHTWTRAKRNINFSQKAHNSNCSTSSCFNEDQEAKGSKENENTLGIHCESLEAYLSMISSSNNGSIPGLHFPTIHKKKRTEKCKNSITFRAVSSTWSPEDNNFSFSGVRYAIEARETSTVHGVNNQQSYKHMVAFGHVESYRKKRSKGLKRVRDLASLMGMIEGKQWPARNSALTHKASCQHHTCMEAHASDFHVRIATKKRSKRKFIVPMSWYHHHWFFNNYAGFHPSLRWKSTYDINALINQFENLSINNRMVERDQRALIPYSTRYREKNEVVLYQQDKSLVPYEDSYNPFRRRKPRPKVDLDDETSRVWKLLLEDINSKGIDGTDEEKEKWWEEERNVFSGRAASFIARMHLVQGDRRFSRWKGSVVDSVIGVFLTQNVSDHLSSSAFMSLAARYPLKSKSSNHPLHEDKSSDSVKDPHQLDLEETIRWHEQDSNQHPAQDHDLMMLHDADSYEQNRGVDDLLSSQNSVDTAESTISAESATHATVEMVEIFDCHKISQNLKIVTDQETHENNCDVQKALSIENSSAEISEVTESNNILENSRESAHKIVESKSNEHDNVQTTETGVEKGIAEVKKRKTGKQKQIKADWDSLRTSAQVNHKRERTPDTMDSLDYEAVRCADVNEIADTIKDRGMNNMLAERMKEFLNRLVRDHGSIDLEWLRDVPPDKAKEYLLSFRGLGLKSVECVRLLTLHHLAFPVDTNVGRIAVRLGWVPLQPLPESLQLHLLELYPILESIQKYLWPRLCKLDQRTLYELHYQMITFGKVFCTKNKPNCNACPMRGECRHFASAFASARLALPMPEEKSIVSATITETPDQTPTPITNQHRLTLPLPNRYLHQQSEIQNHDPVIEEPTTPEPIVEIPATPEPEKIQESDIEDFCEDPEEIPMIRLNMEAFTQNLQTYMENSMQLEEGDMSKALVALTSEAASIPTPKLKNKSQLRTEHQVYELPDSHPLLEGLDKREPDDPCSYLLAIWTPGETAESIQPPEGKCSSRESGSLCHEETCFLCNSIREANSETVRGTLLIPCRTAMRGSFPLNGTYFQVNEVFADHDSSLNPIDVPRSWLWNLPRRTVFFGTSIPTIFKGLTTEGIQYCFWKGFVCVRGFDQKTRAPRPLMARLHFPVSKLKRSRGKGDED